MKKSEILNPSYNLVKETKSRFSAMLDTIDDAFRVNIIVISCIVAVIVVMAVIIVGGFAKKRVAPIVHMTKRIKGISGDDMIFEMEDMYNTGDEIQTLAESFEGLSVRTKEYFLENTRITAEKERAQAELNMAKQIQESMLPSAAPEFDDSSGFEIYADMVPAKNVGGDFFDYFSVDEGHEYAAIRRVGGEFTIEKDNHSMVVSALKRAVFKPNSITLNPGDTLYLYTDGVTEANNEEGGMFGMERLVRVLNEEPGLSCEELDVHVRNRIREFSKSAEQFDDITTLCIKIN